MTLGDPQPLSRRQARELAREQGEAVASPHEAIPTLDVPALAPAALRPASSPVPTQPPATRRSSRQHHAVSDFAEPQTSPAEAATVLEASTDPASAESKPLEPHSGHTPPTLSRRELRALHEREDARQENAAEELPTSPSYPAVRESAALPTGEVIEAELIEADPLQAESIADESIADESVESTYVEPAYEEPAYGEPIVSERNRTVEAPSSAHTGWTPPIGHWSVDADVDAPRAQAPQPDQSLDELINRGIGAGGIPTTTNALILPSIPHQPTGVSPISNTGEIMITGSFDLPRSVGSTGAHPNLFDSSEMDHLIDQLDVDQIGGDSAPVSASRAVSTHASTRGMLTPPKKQRASLPMILVVTTAVLAVSVLALFVTGYLTGSY